MSDLIKFSYVEVISHTITLFFRIGNSAAFVFIGSNVIFLSMICF